MNILLKHSLLLFVVLASNLTLAPYSSAGSFENYSEVGGETERSPNQKKGKHCSKRYYCGPTSTIKLTMLTSGGYSENYDVGENSTFEQLMQMGKDYQNPASPALLRKIAEKKAEHEAQKITITLPLIDYGYSGTFSNIRVKLKENGEYFESSIRDEYTGAVSEFTGSVTIEEYSPYYIKGSYSAKLYRYVDSNAPYRGPLPHQQVKQIKLGGTGSLTGEFNILSPWKDDDRMNDDLDYQSSILEPMRDDIKRLEDQFNVDLGADEAFDKAVANSRKPRSSRGKAAGVYGNCNCSCNFVASASTACKTVCDDAFKVCGGERYVLPARNTSVVSTLPSSVIENNSGIALGKGEKFANLDNKTIERFEKDQVVAPSNLRDKFIALLEQNQPGNDKAPIRKMMLQGFDSMPDDKAKMVMFISLGGKE